MDPEDNPCMCSLILQQILQTGELDITYLMKILMDATNSKHGQFFLVQNDQKRYLCKFTTAQDLYMQGQEYALQDLPSEPLIAMHKSTPLAFIVLENQDIFDSWSNQDRQRIMYTISVGLVTSKMKDHRYDFNMSVYSDCKKLVDQVLQHISGMKKVEFVDSSLSEVSRILYLAADFMSIDAERIRLTPEPIDTRQFFRRTIKDFTAGNMNLVIRDAVPRMIIVDRLRLQQILIAVFNQLNKLKADMLVDFRDYSSSSQARDFFLVLTLTPNMTASNIAFTQNFHVDHLSIPTLELSICKRLCALFSGTYDVYDNNLTMKIKIDTPDDAQGQGYIKKQRRFW